MKKSVKIIVSVLVIAVVALVAYYAVDYICIVEMESPDTIDENGNAIFVEDVPYFGYIEQREWDNDVAAFREYNDNSYLSEEYDGNYRISDYEDGVCIDRYFGEYEEVLVIPETIDGKKVVKLGSWRIFDENGESLGFANAFGCDNETLPPEVKEIVIPSGVKDIVAYSFNGFGGNLKKITVAKDNPYYYSFAGMLFSKETNKLLYAPFLY